MKIIVGALALAAGCIAVSRIVVIVAYGIRFGMDEQKTWEKIERWRN